MNMNNLTTIANNIRQSLKQFPYIFSILCESNNSQKLFNVINSVFGKHSLDKNIKLTAKQCIILYKILNQFIFENKLNLIPIYYESEKFIRNFLIDAGTSKQIIPKRYFGTHHVMLDNDIHTITRKSILNLHDDVILLNATELSEYSLIFNIACLCHEMIHYYDRLFREYCMFRKYMFETSRYVDLHNTNTFETMKDKAKCNGIDVLQSIPNDKTNTILDAEAIEFLYKYAEQHNLILEADKRIDAISNMVGIGISPTGAISIATF